MSKIGTLTAFLEGMHVHVRIDLLVFRRLLVGAKRILPGGIVEWRKYARDRLPVDH